MQWSLSNNRIQSNKTIKSKTKIKRKRIKLTKFIKDKTKYILS